MAETENTIKIYMKQQGLTRSQLAKKSDIHVDTLHKAFRGDRILSAETIRKIAKGLGVSPALLMKE